MKLLGDAPEKYKELAEKLASAERDYETYPSLLPAQKAQLYTCLAHDWFDIDMEEEGHRLLLKANKACPGYFKGKIMDHIKENPDFALLVQNMTVILLSRMSDKES